MKRFLKKIHLGKRFHCLTIIDQIHGRKSICKCDCGKIKSFITSNVINGSTKSCGCLRSIHNENYNSHALNKLKSNIEEKPNGCWEWKKSLHKQGYGHFIYKSKVSLAHRVSWILHKGPIPNNTLVLHHCDNPKCCNPNHLFLGSYQDNSLDCFSKGRGNRRKGEGCWKAKLKTEDVLYIREMAKKNISRKVIGEKFNISPAYIGSIVKRKVWKHI